MGRSCVNVKIPYFLAADAISRTLLQGPDVRQEIHMKGSIKYPTLRAVCVVMAYVAYRPSVNIS